ncbi:N-acetyltransferase [Pseudotabrizicola sp.]|uniref:GNAT family N-acetyltransferase n=1 Tax=Pseudotabrizicola sp. TaxID=2939647 RepID=UPI0027199E74|nr:GNAT family N-acetyltransferase [Pseudotabrizicola sp.]MDO8885129.1 GNAT family N-acetyltransferase [Pseudotabrizicola sp.]
MIRALNSASDRAAVADMLTRAQDYYQLWKGHAPGPVEVDEVFTATPPGCDPAASHRLGLFVDGTLSGVAELSFGFPAPSDAYLGLMILAPQARSQGHGAAFLAQIESLARNAQAQRLYLAVLGANPRGAAFWARMGFVPTGLSRHDAQTGHTIHRLLKAL